jgi:hypothetical protein
MSMFSGFTNQISGWVATKTGAGGQPEEDPNAQQMPPENGAEMMGGEELQAGEGQVKRDAPFPGLGRSEQSETEANYVYLNEPK